MDDPVSRKKLEPSPWLVLVAIPVAALAVSAFPMIQGLYLQKISQAEIAARQESEQKHNYLGIALGILKGGQDKKEDPLREWAAEILSKYSPVPINEELMLKLKSGEVTVKYTPSYSYSGYSSPSYTPSYSSSDEEKETAKEPSPDGKTGGSQ